MNHPAQNVGNHIVNSAYELGRQAERKEWWEFVALIDKDLERLNSQADSEPDRDLRRWHQAQRALLTRIRDRLPGNTGGVDLHSVNGHRPGGLEAKPDPPPPDL
jgi:hypothetical protein